MTKKVKNIFNERQKEISRNSYAEIYNEQSNQLVKHAMNIRNNTFVSCVFIMRYSNNLF